MLSLDAAANQVETLSQQKQIPRRTLVFRSAGDFASGREGGRLPAPARPAKGMTFVSQTFPALLYDGAFSILAERVRPSNRVFLLCVLFIPVMIGYAFFERRNTMDQVKIGTFLKELRKQKGLTQEQLAEIVNVSNRTVSRWENGGSLR